MAPTVINKVLVLREAAIWNFLRSVGGPDSRGKAPTAATMAPIECAASPCTSIRGIFIGTLHDSWLAAITISSCGEGFPFSLSSNCNSNDIKRVQSGERIHGNEQASSTADQARKSTRLNSSN